MRIFWKKIASASGALSPIVSGGWGLRPQILVILLPLTSTTL